MADQQSKNFYNRFANFYGIWSRLFFNKYYEALSQKILVCSPDPKNLLDIGSGTGGFLRHFHKIHPSTQLYAQDISQKMNNILTSKAPYVTQELGSASELRYSDNMFQVVVNSLSFHHYSEPSTAAQEMYRVLQPGGKLYMLDICPSKFWKPKFNIFGLAIGDGHKSFYTTQEMDDFFLPVGFSRASQERLAGLTNVWLIVYTK